MKFVNIFNAGQDDQYHWKSASMAMNCVEGIQEASYQFILQLYIVFNRADRQPSNMQMFSLVSSLISMSIARMEGFLSDKPQAKIKTKAALLPMTLLASIYFSGSHALVITAIQWNVIFLDGILGLEIIICWLLLIFKRLSRANHAFNSQIILRLGFVITLTVISFYVNYDKETTFFNWWDEPIKLEELAIVKKSYFNIVVGICIASAIISLILYYFQVYKPNLKEDLGDL